MSSADILIIGGGIAGISAAAALAGQARIVVLEAEEAAGFHASSRSATMSHYALGNRVIRDLTRASRSFFDAPPDDFSGSPLAQPLPVLIHAREDERAALAELHAELESFAELERLDGDGVRLLCPLLKSGPDGAVEGLADRGALKLDGHALLQGYARQLRQHGGELHTGARIASITYQSGAWEVATERGERYGAPVLINAAGAWADAVARLAGVSELGLKPKRRTIIIFDAPDGVDVARLPFAKTVGDELYFGPETGRLFASPMDEVPSDPCDARPDEYEMALAADRVEQRTTVKVRRIEHSWAGLRTFAPDQLPVAGFAPDAVGFFWLAGQGGAGLQTAPVMAAITASLVLGAPWPVDGVQEDRLAPERFLS